MIALHYAFDLADDFDMGQIRRRVAGKAHLFDDHPGLVQKAFLSNTVGGVSGAGRNEYATFYVWQSAEAARDFIRGDLFKAVAAAFGRPPVRTWTPLAFDRPGPGIVPTFAVRRISPIPENADLARLAPAGSRPPGNRRSGLHSRLIGADWERWELIRFELWRAAIDAGPLDEGDVRTYEVLHLSVPDNTAPRIAAA